MHSGGREQKPVAERRLSTLIKVMKTLHDQYDGVEQVVKTIRHIVDYAHLYAPVSITDVPNSNQQIPSRPDLELRVSLAIDWSLSSGRPSDGADFASYLAKLFQNPTNVNMHLSPTKTTDEQQNGAENDQAREVVPVVAEQPGSDCAITPQSLLLESTNEATELDTFLDFDERPDTHLGGHCGQGWTDDNGLEAKMIKLLENSGHLDFYDLFIPTE